VLKGSGSDAEHLEVGTVLAQDVDDALKKVNAYKKEHMQTPAPDIVTLIRKDSLTIS